MGKSGNIVSVAVYARKIVFENAERVFRRRGVHQFVFDVVFKPKVFAKVREKTLEPRFPKLWRLIAFDVFDKTCCKFQKVDLSSAALVFSLA